MTKQLHLDEGWNFGINCLRLLLTYLSCDIVVKEYFYLFETNRKNKRPGEINHLIDRPCKSAALGTLF